MILSDNENVIFTCIECRLPVVRESIEKAFHKWGFEYRIEIDCRFKSYRDLRFDIKPGGAHDGLVRVFTPEMKSSGTVLLCNYEDGWSSLIYSISSMQACRGYLFRSSLGMYPYHGFNVIDNGKQIRVANSMLDGDKWAFFQSGEKLSVEDPSRYRQRRIQERIDRTYLRELANSLDWPIHDDLFWKPVGDVHTFYTNNTFSPVRTNLRG